ncbi:MAG: TlyA family RNA methyltransferase [Clostridia bacterium]
MRLDLYLVNNLNIKSREKAKQLLESGAIKVNGKVEYKASKEIDENKTVEITPIETFASRGGVKLERGIEKFGYDISGKIFLDVGASNGGFTDCLLKYGAKKVYAIDVGEGQLEKELAIDNRVVIMDKTNARNLKVEMFEEKELFAVSDVSFISLKLIIPPLGQIVKEMLLLIKPQFECGRKSLSKTGIVRDKKEHLQAVLGIMESAKFVGMNLLNLCLATDIPNKNREYICLIGKGKEMDMQEIEQIVLN